MKKEINIILDFDSTIIELETIEVLAEFSLEKKINRKNIYKEIKDITNLAMSGKLSFSNALEKRVSLLNAHKSDVNKTIEFLKNKVSFSFKKNKSFFNEIKNNCYIVSGGFKEIIIPTIKEFNFFEKNIFANSFIYENEKIISVNKDNPLAKDNGKNIIASKINGYNIIIGDGYTDYEVKKYNNANLFIQYIENVNRCELNKKADFICSNFSEVIKFIKNV
jgi:D-3-phosphoglycerate dehydrogenase